MDNQRAEPQAAWPDRGAWFATTHWSGVLAAARAGDSGRGAAALEALCRKYWHPLYAYLRRAGHASHDAEDLVQGFFEQCLRHGYLAAANRDRGRFRSFLLTALKRYAANEQDKARALKRGGGQPAISFDAGDAETRYAADPHTSLTPDRLFERRWALTLLETVLDRLRQEQAAAGRAPLFAELQGVLTASGQQTPMAETARRLGMSEGAVKVAAHRLRRRYRELLLEEIAHTVGSADEIEEERRRLLAALGGQP